MKLVLDTSFIIELRKGNPQASSLLEEESETAEDICISLLSVYEFMVGAHYLWLKYKNVKERLWLEEFLRWITVKPLTIDAIRRAALIKAKALLEGQQLPDMDLLIAATAEPPAKLLTFDEDHDKIKPMLREVGINVVYLKKTEK